jgi:adenylate cyclase
MASPSREHLQDLQDLARGVGLRQVRLVTGAIMFAYLVSHFLNHALGNISTEALAIGVYYHTEFWQFLPVAITFYSACLVHTALGIWALYQRREFHWKTIEPLQLTLGLSVPMLIVAHVVGVRLGQTLYGQEKLYPQELYTFFISSPNRLWLMLAVLVIAWVHGCIGLYFWLRLRPFFTRAAPYLLAAAVLIPTLAMLGIYQGGRATMEDYQDPDWRREELSVQKLGTAAQATTLE